jgi:hypothetical protein
MIQALSVSTYWTALIFLKLLAQVPTPFAPADFRTGSDSYVEQPSVTLATTPAEWNAAWQRHMGITPIGNGGNFPTAVTPPPVDFDKFEVVVIFGGLAPNGGYTIVDSEKKDDKIYLRLDPLSLSTSGGATPITIKANPYAFIFYPKDPDPIIVQFPVRMQDGSIGWNAVGQVGGSQHQGGNNSGQQG